MSKIDTQGMSGEATEGCTDNVYPHDENGEPILPKGEWKELPIFNDKERVELKQIMKQERKLSLKIRRVEFIVLWRRKRVMFINLKLGELHILKVRTLLGLTYMT